MKKAFSLMEIIISIVILSFVMISLIQIKMNNIFLVSKVNENSSLEEYALLSIDFNDNILDKNESIFLSDKYNFQNDDIKISLKVKLNFLVLRIRNLFYIYWINRTLQKLNL